MSSSVEFKLSPDPVLTDVMAAFVDVHRRPVTGVVTVEELLVHLLFQPDMKRLCQTLKVSSALLCEDAEQALLEVAQGIGGEDVDLVPPSGDFPERTAEFEHVILLAISLAQNRQANQVGVLDVLLAISRQDVHQSEASRVLHDHGLTHRLLTAHAARQDRSVSYQRLNEGRWNLPGSEAPSLQRERFIYDLSREASSWQGRQDLIEEGLRLLASARQPHLMLLGPAGVGKSSLAAQLAHRLQQTPCPKGLEHTRVLGLDLDVVLAGCQFRNQMEERLRQYVLGVLEQRKSPSQAVVLWLGNLHHVLAYARKDLDILTALRMAIRRQQVRLMVSATPEDLKRLEEHDLPLAQSFVHLKVDPPAVQDVLAIADQHVEGYAEHHGVDYPSDAPSQAWALVERHLAKAGLPLLLQTLDEAGADAALRQQSEVSIENLWRVVARQAKVSVEELRGGDAKRIVRVEQTLRRHLVNQDEAIDVLVNTLKRAAVGLGEGGKTRPVGAFLFAGPTGVGKTEMAKRLAEGMSAPLERLDMSEFSEKHTIARLIGAPPGYVGHAEIPMLAKTLARSPSCVILLDEFEKAAREVHMLFLQILETGYLTDGQGNRMDFRKALLIFTCNVGADEANRNSIGFVHDPQDSQYRREEALARTFPPELRNRFDHVIQFHALSPQDMQGLVDRRLQELTEQLKERGHRVRYSPALRAFLASAGYDSKFGARPLQRLISHRIVNRLADALMGVRQPAQIHLGYRHGEVQVRSTPLSSN